MDYDKIGSFIQQKRKEKDLTQKELARKLYLTDKAVSKWERGLGCPDVSTLEKLSEILGVSILSILNGEDVNNEDVNNAVLKTVHYSKTNAKNQRKNIISNILLGIVFGICSFLVVINVIHIIYLNEISGSLLYSEYIRSFNSTKERLPIIKDNIERIKESNSVVSSEEKTELISNLEEAYQDLESNYFLNIKDESSITLKKIYEAYMTGNILSNLRTLRILEKYNPDIERDFDFFQAVILLKAYSSEHLVTRIKDAYMYQSYFGVTDAYYSRINDSSTISLIVRTEAQLLEYLTYKVLEVGEVNE